jgi:general secretion pathway protein F
VSDLTTAPARRWRYRAMDARGEESRGDLVASSEAEVIATLRTRALWVVELEAAEATGALPDRARPAASPVSMRRLVARWSGAELESLAVSTRAIATLLAAGQPLDRALGYAASDAADETWSPVFAMLRDRVREGEALAEALARAPSLPAGFAPAVAAAEATGTLATTFERLALHLERRAKTQGAIRSALVYPTLLAASSIVGTLVILLVVVPRFATLLADTGIALPWATRLLLALGSALSSYGWVLLALVVALAVGVPQALRVPATRQRWHAARLRWPVVGAFEQQREAARYLDTLALALGSGVPLLSAMRLARSTVGNTALAASLAPAEAAVRDGAPMAEALAGLLPTLPLRLLEAGEAAGAIGAMAQRAAEAAEQSTQRQLAQAVSLIEPVMIVGFGGVVGFVALALLQAIYGLNAGTL